MTLADPLP
jgi:hypothetical protein